MRRMFLVVLLACAFAASVLAFAPLSFVMKHMGLVERGLTWQQARGTIWKGQVTGLLASGQEAGAVDVRFEPTRLLSGVLANRVIWRSVIGNGSGVVSVSRSAIRLSDVRAQLKLDPAKVSYRLEPEKGVLRVEQGDVLFGGAGCLSASGTVSTDALARSASGLGINWPVMTGHLSCKDGQLLIRLVGDAADGSHLVLTAHQDGSGDLRISGLPDQMRAVILSAGFVQDRGDLIYIHGKSEVESPK